MPALAAAVVEIGPVAVRRIAPSPAEADAGMTAAALAGIDDPVVLLEERPVDTSGLWRRVIGSVLQPPPVRLTVVVPSWWSRPRVSRVMDAAGAAGADIVAVPRSRVFAGSAAEDVVVIEIADDVIAVTAGDSTALLPRSCDPARVSNAAPDGPRVIIDAPAGVTGVDEATTRILAALLSGGRAAEIVPIGAAVAATQPVSTPEVTRRSRFRPAVVAGAAVAVVMCAVGVATENPRPSTAAGPSDATTELVEGRITVRVPAHWNVTRVTAGPGSRRVQVTAGGDHYAALHITQSYVPGESLGATAELLQRELDRQPPGVFTDFRARDQRAGRAVVSYREVRGAREIGWVVLVDGATRIAIGCQGAAGSSDTVDEACDGAVRSAREITGTAAQR